MFIKIQFSVRNSLLFFIQPITLLLLDIPPMMQVVEGVVLELQDCSLPLLHGKIFDT